MGSGDVFRLLRISFSETKYSLPSPAIFIDRDGVINCRRAGDYVLNWSQFSFTPGIREALSELAKLRLPMIVISNQACVGKGLLTIFGLQDITTRMYEILVAGGILIAAAYYCIHRVEDNCSCRKPKPALLYSAAFDYNIDLNRSVFIGDSDTDMQAGLAAGCTPVLFGSTHVRSSDHLGLPKRIAPAETADALYGITVGQLKDCGGLKPSG